MVLMGLTYSVGFLMTIAILFIFGYLAVTIRPGHSISFWLGFLCGPFGIFIVTILLFIDYYKYVNKIKY